MCSVCKGHPGCPCCEEDVIMGVCPDCSGTGEISYNDNGEELHDDCPYCEGTGEVEINDN